MTLTQLAQIALDRKAALMRSECCPADECGKALDLAELEHCAAELLEAIATYRAVIRLQEVAE